MKLKSLFSILSFCLLLIACSSDDTEKFIGTWTGDVTYEGETNELSMVVALGAADNEVLVTLTETPTITGTVDGDNITLNMVTIDDGDGDYTELSGNGSINDNGELIMTFNVQFYDDGVLEGAGTCLGTLTK